MLVQNSSDASPVLVQYWSLTSPILVFLIFPNITTLLVCRLGTEALQLSWRRPGEVAMRVHILRVRACVRRIS